MSPMQQIFLGLGAVAKKTYVDDVFSTFLYKGTNGANTVNNGIDISGEGGLVWVKNRTSSRNSMLFDTVRGVNQEMATQSSSASNDNSSLNQTFTSTGFTFNNSHSDVNSSSDNYSSLTFRKAPGFFTCLTYSGSGSARTISHDLGCVPGLIMIKRTDSSSDWIVYHKSVGPEKVLFLNESDAQYDNDTYFNDTAPTSSVFSLKDSTTVNASGGTYIAYLFAGGESTAATANSVHFNGSSGSLSIPDSADWILGDTFTLEAWIRLDSIGSGDTLCDHGANEGFLVFLDSTSERIRFYDYDSDKTVSSADESLKPGQWSHVALVNNSGTVQWYIDGMPSGSSVSNIDIDIDAASTFELGRRVGGSNYWDGKVSNFRIVKGTAVYTSAFRPPTEPLTNITNTKLLCCNNASDEKGSTVTPGTITSTSGADVSSDSPFDDPAGFVFGASGSESIISTGSYIGNGNTTGPKIYLGWEPQWVMIKLTSGSNSWYIWDSMRGIVTGGNDPYLQANDSGAEDGGYNPIELTATGFKLITSSGTWVNGGGSNYVYMAIRRPDGYVGKPADAGTDVFNLTIGASSTTLPVFTTGVPIDYYFYQRPENAAGNWMTGARLTGATSMKMNLTDQFQNDGDATFDFSNGFGKWSGDLSAFNLWSFKRHAGFDVVVFKGNGANGHTIMHSLGKTPEMIWIKNLNRTDHWRVYHKGLNGGTNPWNYQFKINDRGAESASSVWNQTAPTSTYFTLNNDNGVNGNGEVVEAMLFASTDVSYVGSYTAGAGSAVTITTGFQPRFLWAKNVSEAATNDSNAVFVFDTLRGWGSGNDEMMDMSSTNVQNDSVDYGAPTSTGFTLTADTNMNNQSDKYVFYAHA